LVSIFVEFEIRKEGEKRPPLLLAAVSLRLLRFA